jgi:hypothetical protein
MELELEGAVSTLEPHVTVSYTTPFVNDRDLAQTTVGTGITPVTILSSPSLGSWKRLESIVVANRDTAMISARVQCNHSAVKWIMWRGELGVGERVVYTSPSGWRVKNAFGGDR